MALSNIFREPRREITESVVGLAIVGVLGLADYEFAAHVAETQQDMVFLLLFTPVAVLFVGFVGWLFLEATHEIGDGICNVLQRRGIHLRPRDRR